MKVKELIETLKRLDPDKEICFTCEMIPREIKTVELDEVVEYYPALGKYKTVEKYHLKF